jgi:hypothetical protein
MSQYIFLGGHGDSRDSSTSFTAFLASNLLAQFSRQIVIQIFSSESKKSLWESHIFKASSLAWGEMNIFLIYQP